MATRRGGARGLVIAAPASGQGKTTITLGLIRAFKDRAVAVAAAKAGPDYIDPQFHRAAGGGTGINLDCWAMRRDLVAKLATDLGSNADLLLVEGVMGLFDGASQGGGSTADLAAFLGLPVVLVVDAHAQAQSVAALIQGFAGYRDDCDVEGVIFNRVGSARHAEMLSAAASATGITVLGAIPAADELSMPSRHLGLVQAAERTDLEDFIRRASATVGHHIDLDAASDLARPISVSAAANVPVLPPLGQRIAIAEDAAFSFIYPHLVDGWRKAGAEILTFSPLADGSPPPAADAVFLPGGYPELHAGRLAANTGFIRGLRDAAGRGAVIYGECGGFMVLGQGLIDADNTRHRMAGLLPLETSFAERRLHLGYREVEAVADGPWRGGLRGHEFHYATVLEEGPGEPFFHLRDTGGGEGATAGLRQGAVMGSFIHIVDRV